LREGDCRRSGEKEKFLFQITKEMGTRREDIGLWQGILISVPSPMVHEKSQKISLVKPIPDVGFSLVQCIFL
jgi:hypothetical protein